MCTNTEWQHRETHALDVKSYSVTKSWPWTNSLIRYYWTSLYHKSYVDNFIGTWVSLKVKLKIYSLQHRETPVIPLRWENKEYKDNRKEENWRFLSGYAHASSLPNSNKSLVNHNTPTFPPRSYCIAFLSLSRLLSSIFPILHM